MTRLSLSIGFGIWFLVPQLAAGQGPPPIRPSIFSQLKEGPQVKVQQPGLNLDVEDMKKMYQDIEILRRLLNRDLLSRQSGQYGQRPVYQSIAFSPDGKILTGAGDDQTIRLWDVTTGQLLGYHPITATGTAASNSWASGLINLSGAPSPVAPPNPGAEGTYLRGVGVVYTITLPIPPEAVREASPKPAPPPVSDWERVRREVAGEPVEPRAARERLVQPSLREIVLKTLAENGRHFTHLDPNETLTVVVTFRGSEAVHVNMGGSGSGGSGGSPFGGFSGTIGRSTGGGSVSGRTPAGTLMPGMGVPINNSGTSGKDPNAGIFWSVQEFQLPKPNSARDYELLADLLLKQGKLDEAVSGYKKAVELSAGSKELAGLYRKLAQTHLKREQDVQALDALKELTKAQQALALAHEKALDARSKAVPSTPKPAALPAQLIVSVSKGLADQFASGAVTFDQLRRGAHVELRKFTDAQK